MNLILNTWIFERDIRNGVKQADLINRIAELGVDGVEVRREYFKNFDIESGDVKKLALQKNLIVNYSVPDIIFESNGTVNSKLSMYFNEGEQLGAKKIKLNIGYFDKFNGNLKQIFEDFPLDKIKMNVENDQTAVSGTVEAIKSFLSATNENDLNIGYVYDLGNWAFTHFDALAAAKELAKYTDYIHLKNVLRRERDFYTSDDLNRGILNWHESLKYLPKDVDLALEFPMSDDKKIETQIKLLKAVAG